MKFVTDTHCLFWYLSDHSRLSSSRKRWFDQEVSRAVVIPTIVLAELLYLSRKVPLPLSFLKTLDRLVAEPQFEIFPLSVEVIRKAATFQRLEIHDALITATAAYLELPLLTVDQTITASGLVQILEV